MVKKLIVAILLIAVIVVAGLMIKNIYKPPQPTAPYGIQRPKPEFEELSFDLEYRGLPCGKDQMRYNSYWGFGSGDNGEDREFIKSVKAATDGDLKIVYNPNFKDAEFAAVECRDSKPVKLYFDLNADGKVSDDEIIPARPAVNSGNDAFEFVTPDFTMKSEDGTERPFRALLQARFYNGSENMSTMWSPACVFEGTARFDGMDVKAILFSSGFRGRFDQYGSSRFALLFDDLREQQYMSRSTLSKIITHADCFYDVTVDVNETSGTPVKVTFKKNTSPTGRVQVKLLGGDKAVKVRLNNVNLRGADDDGIRFTVRSGDSELPEGKYEISGGYIMYGQDENYSWNVSFNKGPDLTIEPNETYTFELGDPKVEVVAVDERQRYSAEPEEKSVYSKGTKIFLSPRVVGKSGETYREFRNYVNGRNVNPSPTVEIIDPDGKQIVSKTMEYG